MNNQTITTLPFTSLVKEIPYQFDYKSLAFHFRIANSLPCMQCICASEKGGSTQFLEKWCVFALLNPENTRSESSTAHVYHSVYMQR